MATEQTQTSCAEAWLAVNICPPKAMEHAKRMAEHNFFIAFSWQVKALLPLDLIIALFKALIARNSKYFVQRA